MSACVLKESPLQNRPKPFYLEKYYYIKLQETRYSQYSRILKRRHATGLRVSANLTICLQVRRTGRRISETGMTTDNGGHTAGTGGRAAVCL